MEVDDDKLRNDVERAIHAQQLINDPLLNESIEYLKQAYMQALFKCATPELRETAFHLAKCVDHIKDHLTTVLNDGRLADRQIADLVQAEKRKPGRPRAA